MTIEKTTNTLTEILKETTPDSIEEYFSDNSDELLASDRPFAAYMRSCFKARGILQQEVFANADISEGYGYKIISEEKHTRQRDTVLRLCLGAGFSLDETQRALKIYGMSPLYPRMARDAVLIVAINSGIVKIDEVNDMLVQHGEQPLRSSEIC